MRSVTDGRLSSDTLGGRVSINQRGRADVVVQGDASGSQVGDAAIERARSNVGRTARDLLSKIEGIRLRAESLLAQPEALRASARDQTAVLTRRQLQAELENLPTTALQEVMGKGGKLSALQGAGYRTIAQLLAASADELTAIPGIGPKTAERITTAVRTIADRTAQATRFSFRPDSPAPQQRDLLATVIAIRHADNAASEVAPLLDEFAAATSDLLIAAAPTGRRLSMLVSGRARKRAALAALVQLEAVSNHPRTAWLEQELARHEWAVGLVGYTDERLWGEYSADAATVNATLSTVGGAGATVDAEAAQGFIPEELRQRITAVPLDVRLVKSTLRGYQVFGAQYAIHQERSILG